MKGRLDIAPCSPTDRGVLFRLAEVAFAGELGRDATRVLDALHHDRAFVARGDGPAGYVALRGESDICVVVAPASCRSSASCSNSTSEGTRLGSRRPRPQAKEGS